MSKCKGDPIIIDVDGNFATLSCCRSLSQARGRLDDNYVRVAACLYVKVWGRRFGTRSRRLMLDPTFAIRVLQVEGDNWDSVDRIIQSSIKNTPVASCLRISVVFVPVIEDGHWWCAAFSVNREEVMIIDSMETKEAAKLHHVSVEALCYAMDRYFRAVDSSWDIGAVSRWPRSTLNMKQQSDLHSCGVYMLLAIKHNADRFVESVQLGNIVEERKWLLCEDVMCDFNEARESVKALMSSL
ncbi:uncharacterized protein LOC104884074 [Beta vulgaris subsp. vulgaris]|uniref:uncharacterized protein LOC104884074 n=1 Tax=Beta vulgaris subsp. vulgaris TaxID=3555 RepID=UPI0025485E77|nr:uncharacterized protein LOC104884074 [Beta vulgaris subsp. vulgaris]